MLKRKFLIFIIFVITTLLFSCAFRSVSTYKIAQGFEIKDSEPLSLIWCDYTLLKKNIFSTDIYDSQNMVASILMQQLDVFEYNVIDDRNVLPTDKLKLEKINFEIDKCIKQIQKNNNSKDGFLNVSVGKDITDLAELSSVNVGLFCKAEGTFDSKGKSILISGGLNKLNITLLLVDLDTGKVLWYCLKYSAFDPTNEECIESLIKSLMLEFKYKRNFDPYKLLYRGKRNVTVFMLDRSKYTGNLLSTKGLYLTIEGFDGKTRDLHFKDISGFRFDS